MSKIQPQGTLKLKNQKLILNKIFQEGPLSRSELATALNTTKTTISKNVNELLNKNILLEIGKGNNSLGKKSTLLDFSKDLYNYVFINLAGNTFKFYILDVRGELLFSAEYTTINKIIVTDIIQDALATINKRINHAILSIPAVIKDNTISANKEIYKDLFNSLTVFFKKNNINLTVVNDIELQTTFINEKYNTNKNNLIVIGANYGIGSSILIDNKIYKGETNFAGEIGFLNPKIINGKIQSLENRCSIGGLIEMYYKATGEKITINEVKEKVLNNTKFVDNIIDELATVINNLSYSFDVQSFYLYGLLFETTEMVPKIQKKINTISLKKIELTFLNIENNGVDGTKPLVNEEILKLIN